MFTLYWVYDLPNWLFALLCIVAFVLFGLIGLPLTRKIAKRAHSEDHSHNDIVGYFLGAVTVFYGITLGLVAVGTWTNYSAVQDRVDHEAQIIASLYRDSRGYPEPVSSKLMADLRAYTREIIDKSWPLQRKGISPGGADEILSSVQEDILNFEPKSLGQQVLHAEVFRQFNQLVEARRSRLESTDMSLPPSLWWLVIFGAIISISVTFFFDMRSMIMHRWMTGLMSGLLGLLIFLIAALDNPFRGNVSVGPESLERVYQALMK
ncbi:uncharacterized membrane protein YhaH (DUF805 family) [Silvibacterium bohemicum]|uniref:Uncharacterized membrane protein YhaH (DUF805 family) n=1 Tax=Silvibacterium bohemicum TaxID=1577686 RepID=A0A841JW16_9BACT|nr:DUF4239 domain-containing protein [Silvibacterium bohemicum]MBB6145593.1 uncharacterized membrane protein YhaH (DUF805 family) [Silvibacterium bohemicum]